MERGIYKITNPEGKIYIGLSKNIKRRWNDYKCKTSMKGHSLLKESFKLLGFNNHKFEIKELVQYNILLTEKENNKILREKERHWINFYQSNITGLNQNRGGCGPGKHTPQSKQKISNALKNHPKPHDFGIKRSKDFYTEEWKQKISNSNKGRISPNKGKISPIKGKVMDFEQKTKISETLKGKSKPKDFKTKISKPVYQYDLNGNLINEWDSITSASYNTNTRFAGISGCCLKNRMTANGFLWKFKHDDTPIIPQPQGIIKPNKRKSILQYNASNNLINKWESIKKASISLNIPASNIHKCLNNKIKSAGGFMFKYDNKN